jgi:hypothetical protein
MSEVYMLFCFLCSFFFRWGWGTSGKSYSCMQEFYRIFSVAEPTFQQTTFPHGVVLGFEPCPGIVYLYVPPY